MEGTCPQFYSTNNYSNSIFTSSSNGTCSNNIPWSSLFTILYYSAQSLIPQLDELTLLASVHNPDIICIVEIWLEGNVDDTEISIPGYRSIRLDRNRHGGDVLLCVKNLYHNHALPKPNTSDLELVSVVIQHNVIPT